jgi:hypothetical protein
MILYSFNLVYAADIRDLADELTSFPIKPKKEPGCITFEFINRHGHEAERQVQDELIYWLVKQGKYQVLERSLINRVFDEMALQQSGIMDAGQTKQLEKVSVQI